MNKFFKYALLTVFIFFLLNNFCYAESVKINNINYILKFSNCSADSNSCINRYYKTDEQENDWTSRYTVLYKKNGLPYNTRSFLDKKRERKLLGQTKCYSSFLIYTHL